MIAFDDKPNPGDMVILIEIPNSLLDGLPAIDQWAISEIVGKPVRLNEYDSTGRAELEFIDSEGSTHFIYVSANAIRAM